MVKETYPTKKNIILKASGPREVVQILEEKKIQVLSLLLLSDENQTPAKSQAEILSHNT